MQFPFKEWRGRLAVFFAVIGPGFITANVDNDAGGILTYSQAGAAFGYTLLWTIVPMTIALIVVQEFAGIAGSLQLFEIPKWVSVPIAAMIVWLIIVKGNYKNVEKIFLTAS